MSTHHSYAAFNAYSDLRNGSIGFANSWVIVGFDCGSDRDEFLDRYENASAYPTTLSEAKSLWEWRFKSVGERVPDPEAFSDFVVDYDFMRVRADAA